MPSFLFDVRVAVRRLLAGRGSSLVAILTLSIGIGAVSTMYALFSAGVNDLPRIPGADRIARVYVRDSVSGMGRLPVAELEWKAWLDAPTAGVTLAAIEEADVALDAGARAARAEHVTRSYFDVAGLQPERGRAFANDERGVVVSRRLWDLLPNQRRRLGTTLLVDGDAYAIVGVMPAGFWLIDRTVDVWLPRGGQTSASPPLVIARLDGISEAQAAVAMTPAVQQLRGTAYSVDVRLLATDAAVRRRMGVLTLVGPALLVLAAVCANISALLLGALHARRRELAVRAALGASRWRLAREVLCEAAVIAALGGAGSLGGAYWSIRALRAALSGVSPDYAAMIPSAATVLPVALLATLIAVLGLGYAPALMASRTRIAASLAGVEPVIVRRGRYGMSDLLLIVQIATAAGLVLWTAVFASVFRTVMTVAPNVPIDRLWTISVRVTGDSKALAAEAVNLILSRTGATPGIEAASILEDGGARRAWVARSAAGTETTCTASIDRVAGAHFAAHHFPTTGALGETNEAVLNEAAIRRCGHPVSLREITARAPVYRVSGSVNDAVLAVEAMRGSPAVYELLIAPRASELQLTVLTRAPRATEVLLLRDRLAVEFPRVIFGEPQSRRALLEQQSSGAFLIGKLLVVLAALALLFGVVGLHAAIAQAVTARTREIGVRLALGASPRNVIASTVAHHATPAAIGILLGVGISVAGLILLSTDDASLIRQLAMVAAMSPRSWALLFGLLILATLFSAASPVVRALRVSPAEVLRHE